MEYENVNSMRRRGQSATLCSGTPLSGTDGPIILSSIARCPYLRGSSCLINRDHGGEVCTKDDHYEMGLRIPNPSRNNGSHSLQDRRVHSSLCVHIV